MGGVAERRTAGLALAAAIPGLALSAVAAASAGSIALAVDCLLTLLDTLALAAAWAVAAALPAGARRRAVERRVAWAVAALMVAAAACAAAGALAALAAGGALPAGPGAHLGLALNAGQGALNLALLAGWRRRLRANPSLLARSQVALFSDKLATNVLVVAALGGGLWAADLPGAAWLDPLAGLLIAAASLRFALPLVGALGARAA